MSWTLKNESFSALFAFYHENDSGKTAREIFSSKLLYAVCSGKVYAARGKFSRITRVGVKREIEKENRQRAWLGWFYLCFFTWQSEFTSGRFFFLLSCFLTTLSLSLLWKYLKISRNKRMKEKITMEVCKYCSAG